MRIAFHHVSYSFMNNGGDVFVLFYIPQVSFEFHFLLQAYYKDLATDYNDFHIPKIRASVDALLPHLELRADDILADVGGGTGVFSHLVWQRGILKHRVLCVDPSSEMLATAAEQEGVEPVLASGEEFVTAEYMTKYGVTKLVFAFALHHVPDVTAVMENVAKLLPVGGKCVICYRVNPTLPYFSAAHNEFTSERYSSKKTEMMHFLSKVPNVNVATLEQPLNYKLRKSQWYMMLRNRFQTHLDAFTDEEIEEGIRELEETTFKGVEEEQLVAFCDVCTLTIISKN